MDVTRCKALHNKTVHRVRTVPSHWPPGPWPGPPGAGLHLGQEGLSWPLRCLRTKAAVSQPEQAHRKCRRMLLQPSTWPPSRGTNGRLAGRCQWPTLPGALQEALPQATGVVVGLRACTLAARTACEHTTSGRAARPAHASHARSCAPLTKCSAQRPGAGCWARCGGRRTCHAGLMPQALLLQLQKTQGVSCQEQVPRRTACARMHAHGHCQQCWVLRYPAVQVHAAVRFSANLSPSALHPRQQQPST